MNMDVMLNAIIFSLFPKLLDGVEFNSLVLRINENLRKAEPGEDIQKLAYYQSISRKLELYFLNQQAFLNPSLSQEFVATALQVSTRDLSRTTSYVYDLSFPDFVNSWRIAFISEKLRKDDDWRSYSQEVLAENSGFGSRQSLNNATNRLYKLTPGSYFSAQLENL